jgi:hypothetical protein
MLRWSAQETTYPLGRGPVHIHHYIIDMVLRWLQRRCNSLIADHKSGVYMFALVVSGKTVLYHDCCEVEVVVK